MIPPLAKFIDWSVLQAESSTPVSFQSFRVAMIPREILKKIRQIELRTNRIATETLAGFSLQPSPQFRRVPRAVPDSENFNLAMPRIDGEVNRIRPRFGHFGFARQRRRQPKSFGVLSQSLEKCLKFVIKPPAGACFTFFKSTASFHSRLASASATTLNVIF